jgi:hypothetical protein
MPIGALAWGLLLSWGSVFIVSRLPFHLWHHSLTSSDCGDGGCPVTWWQAICLLLMIFGPSFAFFLAGGFAAIRRWRVRRFFLAAGGLSFLTVVYFFVITSAD